MGKKIKIKRVRKEALNLGVVLFLLAGLLVVLFVWRNALVKVAVEKGVEAVTGLRVTMGTFNLGLYKSVVKATDLKIYNPEGFPEEVMMDIPEVFVNYDLPEILKKKVHFYEMRINIKEFVVVRNEKKELNLRSLKSIRRTKSEESGEPRGLAALKIDQLDLQIGRVIYKDHSARGGAAVKEFTVNTREGYRDISNTRSLISLIVFKALAKTTVSTLTNFDLAVLKGAISEVLKTAVTLPITTLAGETIQVLKGTSRVITNTLRSPFPAKQAP